MSLFVTVLPVSGTSEYGSLLSHRAVGQPRAQSMHEVVVEMSVDEVGQLRQRMTVDLESVGTCNVEKAAVQHSTDGATVKVRMDAYEQGVDRR